MWVRRCVRVNRVIVQTAQIWLFPLQTMQMFCVHGSIEIPDTLLKILRITDTRLRNPLVSSAL